MANVRTILIRRNRRSSLSKEIKLTADSSDANLLEITAKEETPTLMDDLLTETYFKDYPEILGILLAEMRIVR